uniref:Uncharacterized protein n=1 Tax=Arundo donax TaxID=35708 RepID=A0A0A9GH89_ARUDO
MPEIGLQRRYSWVRKRKNIWHCLSWTSNKKMSPKCYMIGSGLAIPSVFTLTKVNKETKPTRLLLCNTAKNRNSIKRKDRTNGI